VSLSLPDHYQFINDTLNVFDEYKICN